MVTGFPKVQLPKVQLPKFVRKSGIKNPLSQDDINAITARAASGGLGILSPNQRGLVGNTPRYYATGGTTESAFGSEALNNQYLQLMQNQVLGGLTEGSSGLAFWNSLSDSEKNAFLKQYRKTEGELKNASNLWGLTTGDAYEIDTDALLSDLAALSGLPEYPGLEAPVYDVWDEDKLDKWATGELKDAYDEKYRLLNENDALQKQMAQEALKENADLYNSRASSLLSNQYLANASTYDALKSDMRRSRQNALEAGASAGVRIAGNINALLTAQNKQSATALETSNALAEQLLQQRQAAQGIRNDYINYMSDSAQQRSAIGDQYRTEKRDMMEQKRSGQQADYAGRQQAYQDTMSNWENRVNSISDTNKLKGAYTNYMRNR